jgi:hypothetical protein
MCFAVDGAPLAPPCSPTVFDSGATAAVIYADVLPPAGATGALAPGAAFAATADPGFDLRFTVGAAPTSLDRVVFNQTKDAVSTLGVGVFFRYDVAYDAMNGRIALGAP